MIFNISLELCLTLAHSITTYKTNLPTSCSRTKSYNLLNEKDRRASKEYNIRKLGKILRYSQSNGAPFSYIHDGPYYEFNE